VFGSCGFLSFSSVFCKFGGRFEASLYIHFTRWVKSRRHSSASRKSEREKKGGKERHSSQCRTPGLSVVVGGLGWWVVNAAAGLGFGGYGGVGVVALSFAERRRCTVSAPTCG
jgi:hypothetical protein